jgi:hypothetical protein
MARPPTLSFDRGTLLLHPPPPGNVWLNGIVKLTAERKHSFHSAALSSGSEVSTPHFGI